LLAIAFLFAWAFEALPLLDRTTIRRWVDTAGAFGPLVIIFLMTLSIVASPIPSAPIAMASGAAYGHVGGAAYVALGSELGAITAFLLARYLGRDHVERWLGNTWHQSLLGSQNLLMLTIFGSRLLPFISFDAMSYAAGLSPLHFWRFVLATFAGILPASFLFAHLGAEAMSGTFGPLEWLVLGLGFVTAAPLILAALWRYQSTTNLRSPMSQSSDGADPVVSSSLTFPRGKLVDSNHE
jgi:uncharacterized membrane protein YdjX (TVP38/TMEM64 family)